MIRLKHICILLAVVGLAVFLESCNQVADPCLQPKNVYMQLGTYRAADTGSNGVDSMLPRGIFRYAENGIVADSGAKRNRFLVQLSSQKDETKLIVSTDSTVAGTDTITFTYYRQLTFLSTSCGYTYHYTIQNVNWTGYNIDSVIIKNGEVNGAANIEHAKIFY